MATEDPPSKPASAKAESADLFPSEVVQHALRVKYASILAPHGKPPCCVRAWHTFLLFTLAPLRIFIATVVWIFIVFLCWVSTLGFKAWDDEAQDALPLSPWRRWLVDIGVRYGARMMLRLHFFWISVKGRENIPKRPHKQEINIVANHISLMDCFYLASVFSPSFVVKADVREWPFIGYIACILQSIFVDRDNVPRKYGSATERVLRRQKRDKRGNICCFPEGTTVNDRYLIKFHSGAFVSGEPVYPVILRYPFRWRSPMFGEGTVGTILKLASSLYWRLEVTHLPVYVPSDEEQANPKLYAQNVRKLMAENMTNPPVRETDISNEDLLEYWDRYIVEGVPATELMTPDEISKHSKETVNLMVPTAEARRLAKCSVAPAPGA